MGVGAGLAIVRRIVSAHGGLVRVERGLTLSGARFIVELDASHAPMCDGDPLLH